VKEKKEKEVKEKEVKEEKDIRRRRGRC